MTEYTPELAAAICDEVAEHGSLKAACERLGWSRRTARSWEQRIPEFAKALAAARIEALEGHADQIITIADEAAGCTDNVQVQAARLRVDARKWVLSKLAPEKYGDALQLTGRDGKDLIPASPEAAIPRLMAVLAILLPATSNSELHSLATAMASKLNGLHAALPAPAGGEDGSAEAYMDSGSGCVTAEAADLAARLAALGPDAVAALLGAFDGPSQRFTPLPGPQAAAYDSLAHELLFGGAAGGSKSYLLLGTAATKHQRSLILRRQSTELDGLIADLTAMLGAEGYNKNEREHVAGVRSIKLGGCREPDDWRAYAGRARDFIGFDEAGEFLEEQVSSLLAWCRSTDPKQRCRIILASNPPRSAEGEWLIRWFEPWLDPAFPSPAQPGELRWFIRVRGETQWVDGPGRYEVNGESYTARSRTFIPARLNDNPYLDRSEYRAGLENLPEPLRSQLLKGDFTAGREDDAWQLIPSDWIAAAQARWQPGIPGPMSALGVDVAQGGPDATCLAPRHGTWYAPLKVFRGIDTKDGPSIAGLVFANMRDGCDIAVDMGGGWGGSAYDHLRQQLPHVHGIVPAEASMKRTKDNKLGFVNKRAELHWKFREALDPVTGAGIALPPDPALAADLAAPRWKYTARGIQVELKEEIRRRLGRSPDRGDAVIIAWSVGIDREPHRYVGPLQTHANVGYESAKMRFGSLRRRRLQQESQGAYPPQMTQAEMHARFIQAQAAANRPRGWRR